MDFMGGAHGNGRGCPQECLPLLLLGDEGDGDREPLPEPKPAPETKSKLWRVLILLLKSSFPACDRLYRRPSNKRPPVVGFFLSFDLENQGIFKAEMVAG